MKMHFILVIAIAILATSCGDSKHTNNEKIITKELSELNEQIKKTPKDASLHYKRGLYFHKNKMDSIALIDLKVACALDSTKANYYSAVGDILFETKDINASVGYIQKALALNPNDVKAQLKISKMFLYLKEYPKLFIGVNNILRGDVYNDEAYYLKGMAYKDLKDTTNAINSFATATKINPDNSEYLMQLALLNINKDISKAKLYFENAYKTDTNNVEPLNAIGVMYESKKENKLAKEAFVRCINIDHDYAKAYYNIACILMDEDSVAKAIKQLNLAITYNPTYTDAYYNRAFCHEKLKDFTKAEADYKQVLLFEPAYELAIQGLKSIGK